MATLDEQADRLERAIEAIEARSDSLNAGEPWPLAELYGTEAEAHWGPREVFAHLDEMLPFWLGEVERILQADLADGPPPFGRTAEDPIRIGIIGRDRHIPIRELLSRLRSDGRRVARRMRELSDEDAGRLGSHPRLGPTSVSALLERFIVSHVEDHADQLERTLADAGH
ncbi:MAG: DinB family protein [Chloroflexi bacterium]|nr:DinB family protein [Chloroflexota bacterium]